MPQIREQFFDQPCDSDAGAAPSASTKQSSFGAEFLADVFRSRIHSSAFTYVLFEKDRFRDDIRIFRLELIHDRSCGCILRISRAVIDDNY